MSSKRLYTYAKPAAGFAKMSRDVQQGGKKIVMNLQSRLDQRVWQAVQTSYEARNFTGAILDAIYFLGDLIRQKTGLSSDGTALVGQAFGGKDPKLKVNKLQSESDWNVQNGMEQMLRGLYQCIRNPRSHEKHTDTSEDADAIILFANLLVKIIDLSKSPFTKEDFLKRVFDPDFVEKDRYAELLVKEIPPKRKMDVFIDVYRQKDSSNENKLVYFFRALVKALSKDDLTSARDVVSNDLKNTENTETLRLVLKLLPADWWSHYDETARLRSENKLIQSVNDGRYLTHNGRCPSGALGTWATNVIQHFVLKQDLASVLMSRIGSADRTAQDYALHFFFIYLPELLSEPTPRLKACVIKSLDTGDVRFYNAVGAVLSDCPTKWKVAFQEAYDKFEEKEQVQESDDGAPF
ncbi:MAG: TIGR02391 family protein [Ignavibacteriae bacterium]|nr:TIGR02391 family protein [Ignavibacteriota bacterium]